MATMEKSKDNFDEKSYKGVHERLAEFREKYPEGSIATYRQEVTGGISFKTVICRTQKEVELYADTYVAAADGHSFLPTASREAMEKVEEYAETVSVGRALAKLGLGVEKSIASAEEMSLFERNKAVAEEASEEEPPVEEVKLKSARPFKQTARFGTSK